MTESYTLHLTEKEATMVLYAVGVEIRQNLLHGHLDGEQSRALTRAEKKLKKLFEAKGIA